MYPSPSDCPENPTSYDSQAELRSHAYPVAGILQGVGYSGCQCLCAPLILRRFDLCHCQLVSTVGIMSKFTLIDDWLKHLGCISRTL
jgi:hypothetical protein